MRPTEFPEAQFSGMDANAYPQFAAIDAQRFGELLALGTPALLYLSRSEYGTIGMTFGPDRKIEDSHDGVSNGLVKKRILLPNGVLAFIIERVEQS